MDYLISVGIKGLPALSPQQLLHLAGEREAGVQHDPRRVLQGDQDVRPVPQD